MATQREVAEHLDLSQAAVSQLAAAGVIPSPPSEGNGRRRGGYDVAACRVAYVRHLRGAAAGRATGDGDLDLVRERARLARAQTIAQERKNLEADGALVSLPEVAKAFFTAARTARDAWLSWPSRVAPFMAAALDVPADAMLAQLGEHVHAQLVELGEPDLRADVLERIG